MLVRAEPQQAADQERPPGEVEAAARLVGDRGADRGPPVGGLQVGQILDVEPEGRARTGRSGAARRRPRRTRCAGSRGGPPPRGGQPRAPRRPPAPPGRRRTERCTPTTPGPAPERTRGAVGRARGAVPRPPTRRLASKAVDRPVASSWFSPRTVVARTGQPESATKRMTAMAATDLLHTYIKGAMTTGNRDTMRFIDLSV